MRPKILITNDDGIDSPGIRLLAVELATVCEVVVVAPLENMSGSGTGIGRFDPVAGVHMVPVALNGDIEAYAIAGTPGLAVMASALGAFGDPPDLVVSGINAGINTGHSVIHSGTVGAALTARTFKGRGLALSLAESDPWQWETAVRVAAAVTGWLCARVGEPRVLNVNVPALAWDEIAGFHWADLDEFGYFSVASASVDAETLQMEVSGGSDRSDPASDTALCELGYVTLTPLSTVEPAPFPAEPAADIGAFSLAALAEADDPLLSPEAGP